MCNAVQPCLESIKAAKRSMSASLLMNHKNLETKVSEKKTKDFNAKKKKELGLLLHQAFNTRINHRIHFNDIIARSKKNVLIRSYFFCLYLCVC